MFLQNADLNAFLALNARRHRLASTLNAKILALELAAEKRNAMSAITIRCVLVLLDVFLCLFSGSSAPVG